MGPRHGGQRFVLDKDAILTSFLGPKGQHMVFLAVTGVNNVSTVFQSLTNNTIAVHVSVEHINLSSKSNANPFRREMKARQNKTLLFLHLLAKILRRPLLQ